MIIPLMTLEDRAQAQGVDINGFHLDALYEAGVDEWEGFNEAMKLYRSYLEALLEDEDEAI